MLRLENVAKQFGGLYSVANMSMEVKPGEVLGLIGPNGAGKTTVMNLISGLHQPTSGKILFEGEPIQGLRPFAINRKGIARTFQLVRPFPDRSALENVMAARLFGRSPAGGLQQAALDGAQLLSQVGFSASVDTCARNLTYIDSKRMELARALATKPKLLLLDEFLAGLNPTELLEGIRLVRAVSNLGISVVMVEHVMKAVMELCHRVVVMNSGEVLFVGPPASVVRNPAVIHAYLGETDAQH